MQEKGTRRRVRSLVRERTVYLNPVSCDLLLAPCYLYPVTCILSSEIIMCGRYALIKVERIPEIFHVDDIRIPPRFNIAPTQEAPIVLRSSEGRISLETFRWGLVPGWAKDESMAVRMINARAETVHNKPAFRDAFRYRRCLVPADGFYEWKSVGGRKQPYYFSLHDNTTFAFAGIWECKPVELGTLNTFSIITCEANQVVSEVHPRMPVIIPEINWDSWLDRSTKTSLVHQLLKPFDSIKMKSHPVSPMVNKPSVDNPECILPKEEPGMLF